MLSQNIVWSAYILIPALSLSIVHPFLYWWLFRFRIFPRKARCSRSLALGEMGFRRNPNWHEMYFYFTWDIWISENENPHLPAWIARLGVFRMQSLFYIICHFNNVLYDSSQNPYYVYWMTVMNNNTTLQLVYCLAKPKGSIDTCKVSTYCLLAFVRQYSIIWIVYIAWSEHVGISLSHQTWDIQPLLGKCRASVEDGGLTLIQQ